MEIYIFAKFHALEGKQGGATQALKEVLGPPRNEPGSIRIHPFRSIRDGRLFYIHLREPRPVAAYRAISQTHGDTDRPCVRGQPHGADRVTARRHFLIRLVQQTAIPGPKRE